MPPMKTTLRSARRAAVAALVLVTLAGAAACGSDDTASSTTTTAKDASSTTTTDPACATKPTQGSEVAKEVEKRGKPTVTVPATPPTQLGITDDVVGTGEAVGPGSKVTVHYVGVDGKTGKEFDSSWTRGDTATFSTDQIIPGLSEGLAGMKVGGRRTVVIPAEKAYGANPPQGSGIGANDPLVFTVDLVDVQGPDAAALAAAQARGAPTVTVPNPLPKELTVTDDVVGTGAVVCKGATVYVHYSGVGAKSGKQFDSSWIRGEPTSFGLDEVIKGWSQGLVGMKVGGRRTIVIPAALAYGKHPPQGSGIEANEPLVFTVDMVGVS